MFFSKKNGSSSFNGQGKRIRQLKTELIRIGYAASEVDYMIRQAKKETASLNGEQINAIEEILEKHLALAKKFMSTQ